MLTPDWQVEWHGSIGSTMDRAAELAEQGAEPGAVVTADFQQAGRGTRGRHWVAPPGSCLMFTIVARPTFEVGRLESIPGLVAASIARYLQRSFSIPVQVKHPNDLVVDGRKVCGVLCTSRITGERLEWLTCGVGLNTHMSARDLPLESATSLLLEGADNLPDNRELLERLLPELDWLRAGTWPSCADYADKPILTGTDT